jgi:hypothetical protein
MFKRHLDLQSVKELLCRDKRRKAIWKSDEELFSVNDKICSKLDISNLNKSIRLEIKDQSYDCRAFFDISKLFPSAESKIWTLKLSKNVTPIEEDKIIILFGSDGKEEKSCIFSRYSDLSSIKLDESKSHSSCEYLLYTTTDNVVNLREDYSFIKEMARLFPKKPERT